jgi:beta-lactamase regulating signal transducer with metallopeptidase domain
MQTASRLIFTFLLNGLWQIPLIAAAAWLSARLLRNGPAAHRHAIWIAALLLSIALPLASLRTPVASATPRVSYSPALAGDASASASASAPPAKPAHTAAAAARPTVPYLPAAGAILFALYLGFTLYRAAGLLWALYTAARLRRLAYSTELPSAVAAAWERARAAINPPPAELLWSPAVGGPVMVGIATRSVIMPESMLAESSPDLLATALGHELGHAARHDFAWNLLFETLALPIVCHPAAHLLLRRIRETRELACDELVTRALIAPGDYARSIITIAARIAAPSQPALSVGIFDGNILEERIRRLSNPAARLPHARFWFAAALSGLALCAIFTSGLAVSAQAQEPSAPIASTDIPTLRKAVDQDPNNNAVRLQLAEALLHKLTPGKDDAGFGEVRSQLAQVLARDAANRDAFRGLATVSIAQKRFVDATLWANLLLKVDPNNTTGLYDIGFIAWADAYPEIMQARKSAGMALADQSMLLDAGARAALHAKFDAQIDDGIARLKQAISNDADYWDAMAYVNLLYRLKAYIANTPEDNAAFVAEANDWVSNALAAKKRVQNSAGAPAQSSTQFAPPPPPPPPPPPADDNSRMVFPDAVIVNPGSPKNMWLVSGPSPMKAGDLVRSLKAQSFEAAFVIVQMEGSAQAYVAAGPFGPSEMDAAKGRLEAAGFRVLGKY